MINFTISKHNIMVKSFTILSSLIILLGCQSNNEHNHHESKEEHEHKHGHANHHMNKTSFEDLVKTLSLLTETNGKNLKKSFVFR